MPHSVAEILQEARECEEERLRCDHEGHWEDAHAWRIEASYLRHRAALLAETLVPGSSSPPN